MVIHPAPSQDHPCGWDKKILGWVDTRNPVGNQKVTLAPVETAREVLRIWTNGNENKEYFLLENRKKLTLTLLYQVKGC